MSGLQRHVCPECGRPFDPTNPRTFTTKPPLVRWRLWLPWLVLCCTGVTVAIALFGPGAGAGWTIWIAMPLAGGTLLGYRVRTRWFFIPVLGLTAIIVIPFALSSMNLTGLYCGLTLAIVLFGPITLGVGLGAVLRIVLKATGYDQAAYLPVLLLGGGVIIASLYMFRTAPHARVSVTTTGVIDAPPEQVWPHLAYFEASERPPPLLLRLGLPKPLGTNGRIDVIGGRTTCVYDEGTIVKQTTDVTPPNRLAFDVVKQDIHFEHDVRLIGGSFELARTPDGGTRMTLTTIYEPLLDPRWCWSGFEQVAIRTLHEHVIASIGDNVRPSRRVASSPARPFESLGGVDKAKRRGGKVDGAG